MGNLVHCRVLDTCELLVWIYVCCDFAVVGNSVEASNKCCMFSFNSINTNLDKIYFKYLLKDLAFSSQYIYPIYVRKRLITFCFINLSRTSRGQDKVSSFNLRVWVRWWFPLLLIPVLCI